MGFGLNIIPLRKTEHWHWRGAGSAEGNYCNSAKLWRQTERSRRASTSEWLLAGTQLYLFAKYRTYKFAIDFLVKLFYYQMAAIAKRLQLPDFICVIKLTY